MRGEGGRVVNGEVAVFESIAVGGLAAAAAVSKGRGVRRKGRYIQHGIFQ